MASLQGVGTLLYADGTQFRLPYINRSSNGWVYKPDVLRTEWEIKRGKNKVFSRSEGDSEARNFLVRHLTEHFEERKWERPAVVDNPNRRPPTAGGIAYSIAWQDSVWGWVGVSLRITPSSDRWSDGKAVVRYDIHSHTVADILIFKQVENYPSSDGLIASNAFSKEDEKEQVPRAVQAWKADPWNETIAALGESGLRAREYFDEPGPGIKRVEFDGKDAYEAERSGLGVDDDGFYSQQGGNIRFFEKDVIKSILSNEHNWEALTELIEAFKFCGFDIRVREEWDYSQRRQKKVSGFEIEVPKQGERHAHTLKVSSSNSDPRVEIECGYEDDERLWIERKQRQAVDQLGVLERELSTFEIDLGSGGNGTNDD